jgi:dihydroorotase
VSEVPSLLIQRGRVIDPSKGRDSEGDLLIENGKIVAIDAPGKIPATRAARTLDAKGAWVTPGLIDIHVHLREPGFEYKETIETGTRAAVQGGFTSVACMANTQPVNDTPYVTAFIREKAKQSAACRVFPVGAVTKGLKGEELAEIGGMVAEGVRALSDDGMPVMNSYLMRKAMDYAKAFGVPIINHAEDWNLVGQGVMNEGALSNELGLRGNPAAAEEIMVAREIALCRLTRCPVHIAHISTEVGLEHVRRAKEAGLPVTAEASPHHLILTEEAVRGYDTHFKMAPPLRTERDVEALVKGVAEGVVDVIATDHAPHGIVDKAVEFDHAANGILGLQTAVPLTYELVAKGIVSPSRWIETLTIQPAKLLGLPYGTLGIGKDADITIFHPTEAWTFTEDKILSKSRNSPFLGWKFKGMVKATIIGGRVVYEC